MSFSEKLASIMARPGQDPVAKDDVPWWLKYAGRGVGTVGSFTFIRMRCTAIIDNQIQQLKIHEKNRGASQDTQKATDTVAIFLGVWNCVSVLLGNVDCLISGMWQMIAGFLVVVCEAPCCCLFVDFVQNLSEWVDKRPYWNRALAYVVLAIPAIILCPSMSSIFGSGLIFMTGVLYGMMALGRKGSRQDMAAMASPQAVSSPGMGPTSDHHATLMEDPDVWRPT